MYDTSSPIPRETTGENPLELEHKITHNHHSSHSDERIFSKGLLNHQLFGCFRKWWYPQIIHFNRDFHYKPSILGSPLFLETPICPSSYLEGLCLSSSASPNTSVWRCRPRCLRFRAFFRLAVGFRGWWFARNVTCYKWGGWFAGFTGEKSHLNFFTIFQYGGLLVGWW